MKDYIEVIMLICFLKLRWAYFHVHPSYYKFSIEGTEFHFQNVKTGTLHSQITIEFNEDSPFYKGDNKELN